eukprot:22105-Alexandrium_andersonii.AAC.1
MCIRDRSPATAEQIAAIAADPSGWTNYRSAEDDPEARRELLDHMVEKGWAEVFASADDLALSLIHI